MRILRQGEKPLKRRNFFCISMRFRAFRVDWDTLFFWKFLRGSNCSKGKKLYVKFVFSGHKAHKVGTNLRFLWRLADRWLSPSPVQDVSLSLETSPVKLVPTYTWVEWRETINSNSNSNYFIITKNVKLITIMLRQTVTLAIAILFHVCSVNEYEKVGLHWVLFVN